MFTEKSIGRIVHCNDPASFYAEITRLSKNRPLLSVQDLKERTFRVVGFSSEGLIGLVNGVTFWMPVETANKFFIEVG